MSHGCPVEKGRGLCKMESQGCAQVPHVLRSLRDMGFPSPISLGIWQRHDREGHDLQSCRKPPQKWGDAPLRTAVSGMHSARRMYLTHAALVTARQGGT